MQDFDFKNQIYLTFFLLKHIKGSREAAFDVRNAGWRLRNNLASARSVS